MTSQLDRFNAQLNRVRLSSDDFAEAITYLDALGAAHDDVIKRSLITSAIVAYARPFTKNGVGEAGEATSHLSVSFNTTLTETERHLHSQLMAYRNEVVAHTDFDRKPVRRLEGSVSGFVMNGKLFDLLSERIDVEAFQKMCHALKVHCFSTMMELNQRIVGEEDAPPTTRSGEWVPP